MLIYDYLIIFFFSVAPVFESWRIILKKISKHIDAEVHPLIEHLTASVDDIEMAVRAKDLKETVRVYRRILPMAKQLLPYFRNDRLRDVFYLSIQLVEDSVEDLESPNATFNSVNAFLDKVIKQSSIFSRKLKPTRKPHQTEMSSKYLHFYVDFLLESSNDSIINKLSKESSKIKKHFYCTQ